jgi:hypothetical protein
MIASAAALIFMHACIPAVAFAYARFPYGVPCTKIVL